MASTTTDRVSMPAGFTDPKDLVILDPTGREAFRSPASDLPKIT